MKKKATWIFLPGFLGYPSEIEPLIPKSDYGIGVNFFYEEKSAQNLCRIEHCYYNDSFTILDFNLSNIPPQFACFDLTAELLSQSLLNHLDSPQYRDGEINLIGYSFGGRMGLHLQHTELKNKITHWVWLSVNPGIRESESTVTHAKLLRMESDQKWSNRFRNEPLEAVMKDWNNQPVFLKSKPREIPMGLSRNSAAIALEKFSLSHQKAVNFDAHSFEGSSFFYGEHDKKFKAIYKELQLKHKELQINEVKDSGHRILNDQPEFLRNYLTKISGSGFHDFNT